MRQYSTLRRLFGRRHPAAAPRYPCTHCPDAFLGILSDETKRENLKGLEQSEDDPLFDEARKLSHDFRDGLQDLFFNTNDLLTRLTQVYGVF
jgi:hypothetical protein